MKIFTHYFRHAAACLFVAATSTMASAFEGKVEMKTTSGKDSMPMTYYVKDTLLRVETKVQGKRKGKQESAAMIMDTKAQEMIVLMDEDKMYMVQKIPEGTVEKVQKDNEMEFKATGRKETIAGVEAEEYVGTNKKQRVEVWVTKELGKFMTASAGGPMGGHGSKNPWEIFAQKENFFPLRSITRANKEGAPEETRMEVTAIDKSKQPDSLFKPPADYQKFEMPSMGDMMRGAMPGQR